MANIHMAYDLAQMQSLPLERKIMATDARLKIWFESWKKYTIYDKKTKKTRFVTHNEEPSEKGCYVKREKKINGETVEIDVLIPRTKLKQTEYIETIEDGQVYVSFSGGKDSTVLADLCARFCRNYGYTLYLLFVNTGLEYPEIQKFTKEYAEWLRATYDIEVVLDIIRPEMRFDEVIKTYGYPVVSKEVSNTVRCARSSTGKWQTTRLARLKGEYKDKDGKKSRFNCSKWQFLLDAPFKISDECCAVMKKKPAKKYERETGRKPIIGTMACESRLREQKWMQNGCNAFSTNRPTSQPLSFWTEQDVLHYIKKYNIPYAKVYGDIVVDDKYSEIEGQINLIDYLGAYEETDKLKTTGCERTGCMFCMFGCHLEKEPNRFQKMKQTHPKQYKYCMENLELNKVLDYIGVPYE